MILDRNRRIDAFEIIEVYPTGHAAGLLRSIGGFSPSAGCKEDDKSTTEPEPSITALTVLERHLRVLR